MTTWTTPKTWATDDVPTAAEMNAHIRDNMTHLWTAHTARVYGSSHTGIAGNGTASAVSFNSETFDSDTLHDNSTNPTRITVPTALVGRWMFGGQIAYTADTGGSYRDAWLRIGGSTEFARTRVIVTSTSVAITVNVVGVYNFTATGYAELMGQQDSGNSLTPTTGDANTFFWGLWLGGT